MDTISFQPIGVVRSSYTDKHAAPRQPGIEQPPADAEIVLSEDLNTPSSLRDLEGFSHIWVLSVFHEANGWKPLVLPPRGSKIKRGVFATRSPHRPNPIGLSLVRLKGIRKNVLLVNGLDLLDGTPVLDIKPYLPATESKPDADSGWIGAWEVETSGNAAFSVAWSLIALRQMAWLEQHGITDFKKRALLVLSTDPFPHSYKRIKATQSGSFIFAWKEWRLEFTREEKTVNILKVFSGYSKKDKPDLHHQYELEFIGLD